MYVTFVTIMFRVSSVKLVPDPNIIVSYESLELFTYNMTLIFGNSRKSSQGRFTVVFDLLMLKSQVNLEAKSLLAILCLPVTWKQKLPFYVIFSILFCKLSSGVVVNVDNKQYTIYNSSFIKTLCFVTFLCPHTRAANTIDKSASVY